LKSLEKTVVDVVKIHKHSVSTVELRIFEKYIQEQVGDPLSGNEFSFYQDLNKISRISKQIWPKGASIERDPEYFRILVTGKATVLRNFTKGNPPLIKKTGNLLAKAL
jgi:hypothetical protein